MIVLCVPPKDVAVEGNNSEGLPCKPAPAIRVKVSWETRHILWKWLHCACTLGECSWDAPGLVALITYLNSTHLLQTGFHGHQVQGKKSQLYSSEFLKSRLANLLTGLIPESLSSFENISIAQTKKNKNLCIHVFFVVCFIKMKKKIGLSLDVSLSLSLSHTHTHMSKCLTLGKW